MQNHISDLKRLALALPDIPRWVETRFLLLSPLCGLFGLNETDILSFVISSPELELISVVGYPAKQAILDAVAINNKKAVILATPENSSHVAQAVPDWTPGRARIHLLKDETLLPTVADRAVRLLDRHELDATASLPPDLKEELIMASSRSPIAATFVEGVPISFCYAAAETERLWDVSIDTLAGYRNQGYAGLCVSYMIEYMSRRGKQAVWGAEETNVASITLAAKLGFALVDQIIVFQPGEKPEGDTAGAMARS